MFGIIFGNFWSEIFWSWKYTLVDKNGCILEFCDSDKADYEIQDYFFKFFKWTYIKKIKD